MDDETNQQLLLSEDDEEVHPAASGPLLETPTEGFKGDEELGVQFENLLEKLGGFGRYQKCIVFLVILPMFFASAFMQSSWTFIAAVPTDHWCHIPLKNLTPHEEHEMLPMERRDGEMKPNHCEMYDLNYTRLDEALGGPEGIIRYINASREKLEKIHCTHGWSFDRTTAGDTLVTAFLLVCTKDFLATMAYLLSSTGGVLGIPLGGYFSDHYGRKRTFFVFFTYFIVFGIASCFAPNYLIFVIIICLQNIGANPSYILPYMVGIEILTPGFRSTFSVLITVAYTLGGVAFTGVAYYVRNWRLLIFCATAPFALFLGFWFVMPESPRWMLSAGRYMAVEKLLRKVAKENGKVFDEECEEMYQNLQESYVEMKHKGRDKKYSWWHLMKSPNLRKKTLLLTYLSCAVNVCYVGLNYYAPALGSDPYLSFLLVGLVELPGSLLTQLIADRLGRRLTMILCFVVGSAALFGTLAVPEHGKMAWPMLLTLFLVAKLFVTSAYTVQELMVYEICPTVLRGEGVALTNIVGYFISNFGPVIVYLRVNSASFPMLVFGALSVGGIFAALALPETLHCPLPETIDEAENFGKDRSLREAVHLWPKSRQQVRARNKSVWQGLT